jgi:hypothetical protein
VKHTPEGDRWHCRQCGDGKYHTVIDFIMRRDNCDLKTALKTLGADVQKPITFKPQPKPIMLPDAEWQAQALRLVSAASDLLATDAGQAGREYLTRRGFSRGTWDAWLLGLAAVYDPKAKRQRSAIVIPWLDQDATGEAISAVKYRFMDDDPEGLRYIGLAGSIPLLFGLWDAIETHETLLLVEGEFNALSVWQCRPRGVSVLSFGSEGGGRFDVLQIIAKKYQDVFVWADDIWDNPKQVQHAKDFRGLLKGTGQAIQSVKRAGVKQDANELLKLGALADFLSHILGVDCLGKLR